MWFKDWYEPLKFWPSTNILQLTKQKKQTNKVQSMFEAVLVGGGEGGGVVLVYLRTSDHGSDRPLKKPHFFFLSYKY